MENKIREIIMPLSEKLCKRLSELLEKQKKSGAVKLDWIEMAVFKVLCAMAVELIVAIIGLLYVRGYEGSKIVCTGCGNKMKFQEYTKRPIISIFGHFSYERAYYYCKQCKAGLAPLDEKLGLGKRKLSPMLQRVIGFLSSHLSFGIVRQAIGESYKLEISDEAIREVAEEMGQQAIGWEDKQKQEYADKPLPQTSGGPKTWVIEVDGKKVGFQDGSWQEVKVGVIYEISDRVETIAGRNELIEKEIIAKRSDWEEFSVHFWAAMHRAGIREGDRIAAVADGAESIEQIFQLVAPDSERIRDFYHVSERIHAIGELRFGAGSSQAKPWIKLQLNKLKESDVSSVIRSISRLEFSTKEAEEIRRKVLGYFQNHRHAMDYARYKGEGLPISSGAVEGGCKLIGARTNGSGRRWSEDGCDKIVALRVCVLNNRLDLIRPLPRIELKLAA